VGAGPPVCDFVELSHKSTAARLPTGVHEILEPWTRMRPAGIEEHQPQVVPQVGEGELGWNTANGTIARTTAVTECCRLRWWRRGITQLQLECCMEGRR
jgi:hypothetical protein